MTPGDGSPRRSNRVNRLLATGLVLLMATSAVALGAVVGAPAERTDGPAADGPTAGSLADLDVPVTIVWGREADLTPLAYGRDLAEAADARLVVFEEARLLPHVEHADRFLELLEEELLKRPQ